MIGGNLLPHSRKARHEHLYCRYNDYTHSCHAVWNDRWVIDTKQTFDKSFSMSETGARNMFVDLEAEKVMILERRTTD